MHAFPSSWSLAPSSSTPSPPPPRLVAMACAALSASLSVRDTTSLRQRSHAAPPRTVSRLVVRAQAEGHINPDIQKDSPKVADTVAVSELAKPVTAYCRCWRSKSFPLCDGTHVKHNTATGDNVGPLLLKK